MWFFMSWFCDVVLYVMVLLCGSLSPGFAMWFFMSWFCYAVLYVLVCDVVLYVLVL